MQATARSSPGRRDRSQVVAVAGEHGRLLRRIEDPFGDHWEIGRPPAEWSPPGGRGARP
jgi:hypothetical protein